MPGFTKLRLAIVVVLAIGLRWQQIGQLSLNHFDEGVLVSGAFGAWLHGPWHFPLAQPLQAPPLYPWMVAGTFALTGATWPIMGIYLSAALGSATVVIYFALLRRLYGDTFAVAGAGLLAASDLHVAFSRMALTDVPLTFWFVTGAYAFVRLVEAAEDVSGRARWRMAAWSVAFGLAAGAAWNTKYNGWMLVAIAGTAWLIVFVRQFLPLLDDAEIQRDRAFARRTVLLAIGVSALVATACFAPWYLHVERTYPGGYGAVTENHLRYVGGLADWPHRAARLWRSLAAFRHLGWLTTLLGLVCGAAWLSARFILDQPRRPAASTAVLVATAVAVLAALAAAGVLGGDAVMVVIAAAAIAPALVFGRWTEVVFAVWAGAFLVLTPFYHPYTRLLVPSLPAVIALAVWLVSTALQLHQPEAPARNGARRASLALRVGASIAAITACQAARVVLALAATGLCVVTFLWQPFGLFPSRGAWDRWSSRQSYRALGDAVLDANLPADAVVLCQGPPAMTLYVEREWAPLERLPFHLWLPHVSRHRDCYLAVDFWGLYGENHQVALRKFLDRLDCLEPIVTVPNDLNVATLLDYLSVEEVAQRLSQPRPPKTMEVRGQSVVVPASLTEPYADLIVLYRIDRQRLELLDKQQEGALK